MTDTVDQECLVYSRFVAAIKAQGLFKFASFRKKFPALLIPSLRIFYAMADLNDAILREFHTLCIQYSGSDLVEDRDSYFYWSLGGKEPTMRELRLYVSRLFVSLAGALGGMFWKDGIYRSIAITLERTPHCMAEEQVHEQSLESVEDLVLETPAVVQVLDESEVPSPVVATEGTRSNDIETTPHPIVLTSTEPSVTKVKGRKRKSADPDAEFSRLKAFVYRADGSDEVKARWKRFYNLIHAKSDVTKRDDYAYHLYKKINIRLRSDFG